MVIRGRLVIALLLSCAISCYRAPAASDLDPDAAPDATPDAQPDAVDDALPDGNPDATPDGPSCTPACSADNTQLLTCNGNEPGPTINCDLACSDTTSPHCLQPILSNGVEAGIPLGVGAIARNCGDTALRFYANGQVIQNGVPIRSAGFGEDSGIGFHQVGSLLVFSFESLALTDCVVLSEGNRPLALVSRSTMMLANVHAQFSSSLGVVSSGGTTSCAPGGSAIDSGGGGGGASNVGGKGADLAASGVVCTTPFVDPKTGSEGGSGTNAAGLTTGRGGPPGGALQLSARYQLDVTNSTFSLGGAGGEGAASSAPGGGGGSGGTLMVEADKVSFNGRVFANGGGGGGTTGVGVPTNGEDGPDGTGPLVAPPDFLYGGLGSSRDGSGIYPATNGTSSVNGMYRGGGGGGLGFFRINTNALTLDPANQFIATYSQATLPLQ